MMQNENLKIRMTFGVKLKLSADTPKYDDSENSLQRHQWKMDFVVKITKPKKKCGLEEKILFIMEIDWIRKQGDRSLLPIILE